MPMFKSKPKVIDAERFVVGKSLPRGVRKDEAGFHVITIQGVRVDVKIGEWIVDEGDGEHFYPIADDTFCGPKGYDPL